MRHLYYSIFCTLIILGLGGCTAKQDMILEYKDVQFFKAEAEPPSAPKTLRISGLAFHSALSVGKITSESEAGSLVVLIHLIPATKGTSGSFAFELSIPDSIRDVRFGNERVVIWKR